MSRFTRTATVALSALLVAGTLTIGTTQASAAGMKPADVGRIISGLNRPSLWAKVLVVGVAAKVARRILR